MSGLAGAGLGWAGRSAKYGPLPGPPGPALGRIGPKHIKNIKKLKNHAFSGKFKILEILACS